ncbi:MAG TPA: hypothetical protein VKR83_09725 [Ktedonobacteraceae bacterium]|nr:hypothetical protein [Ktedonobacteraceae bacterium]
MEYRGIIHNHSACSKEGCYSLRALRQRWAPSLDFAAMTEHAERTSAEDYVAYLRECDALSDERFRFIPGLEVSTESGDMLLLGCRTFICTRDPMQVMRQVSPQTVVILAHPEEGKVIAEVLIRAHGLEGWNGGHMGGYMPPVDWLVGWRKRQPAGKFFTGGNDIHKVDPKRKILTLVQTDAPKGSPCREEDVLGALRQGNFRTGNGIFSYTPDGTLFYHEREIARPLPFALLAWLSRTYRWSWRGMNGCLQLGGTLLGAMGMDKQKRTQLNRFIRQHL